MKRKATSSGGTAKKAAADQKYDSRTGRWMVVPRTRATASTVAAVRAAVMEKKGMDTTMNLTSTNLISTTNTNAAAFVVNLIQQGSGSWNRVGRRTTLKSLRITGVLQAQITPDPTTGELYDALVRMVVVWDKQPSGAAIPTFDQIFGITAQDGTESTPSIWVPPRYDNMERFRVIRDCKYELDPMASPGIGTTRLTSVNKNIDEYIKLPMLESNYSGQSTPMTIADISSGALYVYFRAEFNGALSRASVISNARIRYVD